MRCILKRGKKKNPNDIYDKYLRPPPTTAAKTTEKYDLIFLSYLSIFAFKINDSLLK